MDAAPDEASRATLNNYVDVICHGDVYRKQIRIIRRDGQHPEATYVMARDETRNLKQAIARKDSAIAPHRVRCRNGLVMRQVGKPLHSEQSLRAAFSALHDACTGEHAVTTLPTSVKGRRALRASESTDRRLVRALRRSQTLSDALSASARQALKFGSQCGKCCTKIGLSGLDGALFRGLFLTSEVF